MDIQLYATDEELKEFPEDKTDPDQNSSPNSIHLLTSDLSRPHIDLPRPPTSLPVSTTKIRCRCKAKRSGKHKSKSNSKDSIVTHSVVQLNECLLPIQEKRVTHSDECHGLPVRSVIQLVTHSARGGPAHSRSACCQSAQCRLAQCGSAQCSHPTTVVPAAA